MVKEESITEYLARRRKILTDKFPTLGQNVLTDLILRGKTNKIQL
jgi:hypothetical protein